MSSPIPADDVVDRLASLPLLAAVPRGELEWATARGEVRTYGPDTLVRKTGDQVDEMFIVLSGRVGLYVERQGGWRQAAEGGVGQVMGLIPYSRFQKAPGNMVVEEDAAAFVLHRRHFPDLIRECPGLTAALVHHMIDRARDYRTAELNDDRLESLGRLAAGLAHELNNPASAAERNAQALGALLAEAENAARGLAAARLTDAQLEAVDAIRRACTPSSQPRTALEAADREDELSDWLVHHDLDPVAAETLAASDVSLDTLGRLAAAIPPDVLGVTVRWVASGGAARRAAQEIASATARIHDLVGAVKGFTFMDRNAVPEDVDVARGLADTVAVLENKLRATSVVVGLETASDLPRVHGFGSEINQVWEKLIDNAIDAAGRGGRVTITATSRGDVVVVRVVDDGPGIPEEHRTRIFDPFFTTKPPGQGTGLGLDLARRIVHLHRGDIDFTSHPGRTVFRVRLPVTGAQTGRGPVRVANQER